MHSKTLWFHYLDTQVRSLPPGRPPAYFWTWSTASTNNLVFSGAHSDITSSDPRVTFIPAELLSNTITSHGLSFLTCSLRSNTTPLLLLFSFIFAETLKESLVVKTQTEEDKLLQSEQESIKMNTAWAYATYILPYPYPYSFETWRWSHIYSRWCVLDPGDILKWGICPVAWSAIWMRMDREKMLMHFMMRKEDDTFDLP